MADFLPVFSPGKNPSYAASAVVTGGRLCMVSGAKTVAHASANTDKWVGTAAQDTPIGQPVNMWRGGVQQLVASGAVAAGDRVGPATDGKVASAATVKCGTALTAAADGALTEVVMDR